MSTMTVAAALAIANACLPPSVAPIMVGIAQHESGLDPNIVHRNANGTIDVGLAQVNSANFGWLGLTPQTALDPCRNLAAGAAVLFAKYNGDPPGAAKAAYAAGVAASINRVTAAASITATAPVATPEAAVLNDRPADTDSDIFTEGNDNGH